MKLADNLGTFWGKYDKQDDSFHPLAHHCADVAACTEAILTHTVLNQRFTQLLGVSNLSETIIQRLSVLAALHDLGKFNLYFQYKVLVNNQTPPGGHITELLDIFNSNKYDLWSVLPEISNWFEPNYEGDDDLLVSSICHHGKPVALNQDVSGDSLMQCWEDDSTLKPFKGIAELMTCIKKWFPLAFEESSSPIIYSKVLPHIFSGLVTLADWIGSSKEQHMFPYSTSMDDRMPFARRRALQAIYCMGVSGQVFRDTLSTKPTFNSISKYTPRPMQDTISKLPINMSGSLSIIESETGSGKTEAALYDFMLKFYAGLVDGMYFALPTRTAATQLHTRVTEIMARAFPGKDRPAVTLAVPGYIKYDDNSGKALPHFKVLWDDDKDIKYRSWAAEGSKKYISGSIVIGTIDQILMSVLRVKHSHMRATALLRHLIVIDEVHASDTYMNSIALKVLETHLSLGGHTLLMSATLGSEQRLQYQHLINKVDSSVPYEDSVKVPYPIVHYTDKQISKQFDIKNSPKNKNIKITTDVISDDALAARALATAQKGARVLIIKNTVSSAVNVQQCLEKITSKSDWHLLFTINGSVTLHHSRFCKEDREALDKEIESRIGKESEQDKGCIIVATQTVQQSLDLDADILFTDLAPADILLQRIGRVHRHESRNKFRPSGFETPTCIVMVPEQELESYIQPTGVAFGPNGIGTVYADIRVLQLTKDRVNNANNGTLLIPEENREVIETTLHSARLATLSGDVWDKHSNYIEGSNGAKKNIAQLNIIKRNVDVFGNRNAMFNQSGIDEKIMTRLGDMDLTLEVGRKMQSPLGCNFFRINIPYHLTTTGYEGKKSLLCDSDYDLDGKLIAKVSTNNNIISIDFINVSYQYTRLGLVKL